MKSRILLVAALAAAPAAVANAQSSADQEQVGVEGFVASLCVLGPPSRTSIDLGQLAAMSGARVGRIAPLASQHVTLPGSFCNFAGTALTVSADALVASDAAPVQPGFARAVNYISTIGNWAVVPATVATGASAGGTSPSAEAAGGTQPSPKIADLDLQLSGFSVPSDLLLVAGAYSGSVTITLGPAITTSPIED